MSLRAVTGNILARVGTTVTLRQKGYTPGANPWDPQIIANTDTEVKAFVRRYKPQEVAGLVQQGDRIVSIDGTGLATAPANGDEVLYNGIFYKIYAIEDVSTGPGVVRYNLSVRG